MRKIIFISLLTLISIPSLTYGEEPLDVLQSSIDKGVSILKDPHYQDTSRRELQRQRLCETASKLFDFEVFSRLVLASNWKSFTEQQKAEFTDVFARFLCKYYLTKLQEKYSDEKIIFVSQKLISDFKASIKVQVIWRGMEVPVEIRMLMRHGLWKVYDVNVLGISAVLSYREQFRALLLKDSPAQVIELIENKIKQVEEKG